MELTRVYIFALIPITIAGLLNFLDGEKNIRVTGYSDNFSNIELYIDKHPDDILFIDDSCFEKEEFISILNQLLKHPGGEKIILYTGTNDPVYLKYVANRGIRGIIHKKSSREKVIEAIRVINIGGIYIDNNINISIHKLTLNEIENVSGLGTLSRREKDIVNLISKGFTNKKIAGELSISVKTVENHKERIKNKLGIKNIKDLYALLNIK